MQNETAPIRQNRLANLLIEASPVAIILTDPAGIIDVINHVTESWFGYREPELVGKSVETIIRPTQARDAGSQPTCFPSHLRDPESNKPQELLGRRKDGSEFFVRVTLHPLVTISGKMVLVNVVNFCESDSQLEKRIAGERLAAVLEMASGLSHESRNALHRARSCLDLLELDLTDRSELLHLTQNIRTALSDLHGNYEEVKDYAAPIVVKRTLVSLPFLIQTAFDEVVKEFSSDTPQLRIESELECQRVPVDAERMKRVFRSLFDNAIQATPATGEIELSCRCIASPDGNLIEITIRDHGVGMSEDAAKRMFEPFFTTKQQGNGLGLPVCRRIVEAHEGTIEAANHPAGGVIVQIVIPS